MGEPKDVVDEIFEKLGSIGAKVDIVHEKTIIVDAKLTQMNEHDVRLEGKVDAAHKRIDELVPLVNNHEALKNKGLGVAALLGLIGSGIGYIISVLVK